MDGRYGESTMKQRGDRRQEGARKERSDGREGRREKEKSEGVSVYESEKGEGG